MGEVLRFPPKLRLAKRLIDAHQVVACIEGDLQLPEQPTSGLSLVARTALVQMAHIDGAEAAARRAEEIAASLRTAAAVGWCVRPRDDDPRPAA
jgi:hypothetical protein